MAAAAFLDGLARGYPARGITDDANRLDVGPSQSWSRVCGEGEEEGRGMAGAVPRLVGRALVMFTGSCTLLHGDSTLTRTYATAGICLEVTLSPTSYLTALG